MKARIFKEKYIRYLMSSIRENLDLYRTSDFSLMADDSENYIETSFEFSGEKLSAIDCDKDSQRETENCEIMYEAMGGLSNYMAREERLWTFLTHTLLLNYVRKRWPIPDDDEKAVKHIQNHFFCVGARGIERDNAASRLWWIAHLCQRVNGMNLRDSLTCLLLQSDVRASLIERPTVAQNINIFSAIISKLNESFNSDKKLFEREKFRNVMKWLNLMGGTKLLGALSEKQIISIVDDCIRRND